MRVRKIENRPPTALFTADPAGGQAPLNVSFDASASTDPDGRIAAYAWSFGDGVTATGTNASHQYPAAGTYDAKLTVTDDSGASVSATKRIAVSAPPPSPPPPPPPPVKPRASQLSVGRAVAGKAFTVSMTVTDSRTGKSVHGRVSCMAKLAGKPLPVSRRTNSGGRVSCTWQLPATARGTFKGSIADSYEGITVSRSFSTRVLKGKK
jgi:PKD repeat protein